MCQQSENQVHCNDAAFVPEFSEGDSSSSFFEWKWTAGSMSGLDAEVEWQPWTVVLDLRKSTEPSPCGQFRRRYSSARVAAEGHCPRLSGTKKIPQTFVSNKACG